MSEIERAIETLNKMIGCGLVHFDQHELDAMELAITNLTAELDREKNEPTCEKCKYVNTKIRLNSRCAVCIHKGKRVRYEPKGEKA